MKSNSERNISFDILRIFSMILVVLFHYTAQFNKSVQKTEFVYFISSEWSYFAVSLFLLMVGFFSFAAIRGEKLTAFQYLKKRFTRLIPTFWFCLTITTIVLNTTEITHIGMWQFLLNVFLVNRFLNVPFVDGAYWYMLILVAFTIIIAFLKVLKDQKMRNTCYILYTTCFIILGLVNRFVRPFPTIISFALFEYINKCFVGLFVAFVYYEKKPGWEKLLGWGMLAALLTFGEFLWISKIRSVVEIVSIIVFVIVVYFGDRLRLTAKAEKIIETIAAESYFVYLIHQQNGFVIMKWLINNGTNCNLSVLLTGAFIAAIASVHYILSQKISLVKRKKSRCTLS